MFNRFHIRSYCRHILCGLLLLLCYPLLAGAEEYHLTPADAVTFACRNVVGVATYDWPSTLVTYPVTFSGNIRAQQLCLTDRATGQQMPFQLSDVHEDMGYLRSANVSFMAALPYQGAFEYELAASATVGEKQEGLIPLTETADAIEISGSKMQVRLPKTQVVGRHAAPAPLMALNQGDGWAGRNQLLSPRRAIVALQSETTEHGPLFTCQRICYTLEGGAEYTVHLTVVKDYPFVILDEGMTGLSEADSVRVDMAWESFEPTKRFATHWDRTREGVDSWLGIDSPVYTSYCQEDPHWTGLGWVERPAEQMIFRLSPFGGNSVREQTPVMSFWEEGGKQRELGVFVYDFNRWDDRQYGIWQPTPTLSVYFRYTDGILHFTYPLATGTRSTAIAFFPEREGQERVAAFNAKLETLARNGGAHKPDELLYSFGSFFYD